MSTMTDPKLALEKAENAYRNYDSLRGEDSIVGTPKRRMNFDVTDERAREAEKLARQATRYAEALRDEDPQLVWDALTLLDRHTLQAMTVTALAAIGRGCWQWVDEMGRAIP